MDWIIVECWLENKGYILEDWEITTGEDFFFAERKEENTYLSLSIRNSGELYCYVGCCTDGPSVGGSTGVWNPTHYDVVDFLKDELDDMFEHLNTKVLERMGN